MKSKIKPGIASLIVFTASAILIFWAAEALDAPREVYAFISLAFLLIVWWSAWRHQRRLSREIEEVQAEAAVAHQQLRERSEKLEAEVAQLRGGSETRVAAATAAAAVVRAASPAASPAITAEPAPSIPPPPPPSPSRAAAPIQPPVFAQIAATSEAGPGWLARLRSLLKFEELLGTNLIAKVGALLVVLGVVYGLNLALRTMGPVGKVAVGWATGAVLLGAGVFFERKERYRIVARAAVAAGWGVVFFTAFAMNHIPAAKVLSSESADLVLMFAVAAAMVLHTLRYRSQVATGLAFLAAFTAIFATVYPSQEVPPAGVSSLAAAVVLAIGVAWVALRMQWFVLETCAIVATYLNHFVWLIHIIRPMGKHHHHFAEFFPSAMILVSYWAIYRASYLIRRGDGQERISALGALLNVGFLLAVLKYQSVHPEYAFWALLVLGAVELGLGQLPQAWRRSLPRTVLTVIGACLLFAAIPFRTGLEAKGVSLLWLTMAQAFFLVGVFAGEKLFRRVGLLAFVPLAGQLISVEIARIFGARMDGSDVKGEFLAAAVCALPALVIYINVHWGPRHWPAQFSYVIEQKAARDLSYAAGLLALAAGWLAFPSLGTAVSWMVLACAFSWLSTRFDFEPLRWQSIALATFAFVRVLVINLPDESFYHLGRQQVPARVVTTLAVVVLCYLAAHWHRAAQATGLRWVEPAFTWAASTMFTLLMWHQLSAVAVGIGWGVFALAMLETGLWRGSVSLRLQAYVAGICAFLRLLFVNLNASAAGGLSPRLYSIIPLAAIFFYFYQRLDEQEERLSPLERKLKAAPVFAWLGTTAVVLLLRFEVPLDWVATAWAAVVLAAMALAWRTGRRVFAHQAMLLSLAVIFRGVLHNLYERSYFHPVSSVLSNLTTISAVGLLFASLVFAFKLRRQPAAEERNGLMRGLEVVDAHPEQLLFFVALVLFTAFLGVEMRSGLVTLSWSLEAVAVFLVALWIGERSYRVSAMALLLVCIGRIVIVDMRHMVMRDKAITFTALGALLLGVSILYSRNREKVRQFL